MNALAYPAAVGKESRARRGRTQQQGPATPTSPAPIIAATEPLLAKYRVEPLPGLPDAVHKFHLRIVTDILEDHEHCEKSDGMRRATGTWHRHHDGLAASRPGELNFAGTPRRLACTPGCNHCCRSPVGVVAAEAVLVADFIDRTFSAQDRLALQRRIAARKAALPDGDPLRSRAMCPLNSDGQCLAYAVRPYNCRIFHSFAVDACEQLFVAGEAQRGLPIDPVRAQYDRLIAASARVAFHALKLDMRLLEFMAALELALAAGERRCERLAAGEDLFSSLPTITPPTSPASQ